MDDHVLVDAYNDHCYGSLLVHKVGALVPRPSNLRRLSRSLRRGATLLVAACTLGTVVLVAPPLTITSGAVSQKLPPPPNTIHHTKIIGHIQKIPATCGPVPPPSPPPPSITTLAYVAEASSNEVQTIDEATGALVGTPITVGTSPKGIGYWRPPTSSHFDPEVVVSNSGSHSVTLIDAITQSVIATISVPSGSSATAVATSPTNDFALVVDTQSGKVSVINLNTNADQGEISLTSTANVLTGIAFSPSGQYAYVTDPSQHKIFVIQHTVGTSPYYFYDTTYTNSSYDFSGIGSDLSTSSSGSFYVTDAQASGYLLKFSVAGTLSAPTQVAHFNSPSMTPGAISVAPGSTDAWVAMTGTYKVDDVALPGGAITTDTVNSSFTAVGPIGLSADGATLLAADTGSGNVQELATSTGTATNSTAADSTVWAIAPALASPGSWDAYVATGSNVDVVNTSTLSLTQTIADSNGPISLAAGPDGQYVYVANQTTPSISIIQTSLVGTTPNPIVATFSIPQGAEPHAPIPNSIAINPQGTTLLVGDIGNGAVDVIDVNPADTSQYKTVVARLGLFGSGISSSASPQGITVGPQGTFAYVTEGSSTTATDGVAVLQYTGSTTTGYSFLADNEALAQGSDTMYAPAQITINPNGESAYVEGFYSSGVPNVVFTFPIGTNGELSNGSGSPVGIGYNAAGLTFSPEDQSVFATSTTSYEYSSISIPANSDTYDSATDNSGPGAIAVSADGLFVAVGESTICGHGANGVALYDAGSGTELGSPVALTSSPQSVVFAPQSSPQTVSTSELVGNASNPAESAVSSGMNDVVTSGTPSDAPGASAGVDTATGAYSMSIDSMTIPDIGISLDQSATYDSSRASVTGLLGKGWDYTYGITASQNSHSASTNPCAIIVTQEDGATVAFFPSAKGPYSTCPSSGYEAPGWAQATMTFQSSCNGTDSCYVMTRGAMTKYYIDETTGQLVKVADLNGSAVTITWGSHSACSGATSTEPCQVTAADGIRKLTYSYSSPGAATCPSSATSCVVVTDPLSRTLTYALNSSNQLASVSLSNRTQTATYAFAYNSSSQLTSWWDPNDNAAHAGSTTYATDVTWTGGKVTQVTGPPIASVAPLSTTAVTPTTTLAYTGFAGSSGNGTVLVQNPDFNQSNHEPGASETLDTYADYQLVSSVVGYGPVAAYYNGSTAPVVPLNPSEAAYPMRDGFNLMPSESMNALAGTRVPAIGTQNAQYDSGVAITTYDAHGNALSSTDQSGNTTSSTYNGLDETLSSTDAIGNVTTSTYNSTGQLLVTTPPANSTGGVAKTSNWYNSNGTLCASRDAIETSAHGVLSSCVSAGSNAMTYSYDSSDDQTLSTVTDTTTPSTVTSTTQSVYDADGNTCATLSPNGYALGALSSCPSGGMGYATVNLSLNEYNQPTKVISSLTIGSTNTYATSYTCTDSNGDTTASVGPTGSFSSCSSLSPTTSVDASFATRDANGDVVQSISPLATSGTQGPTTTTSLDANGNSALSLSAYGYVVWEANNSATLTPYETASLVDDMGNQVSTAPAMDNVASCVDNPGNPCPDTSITTYDNQGQSVAQVSAGNGESSSSPIASTTIVNPNGTTDGGTSKVGGGSTGVTETSQATYNAAGATTNSVTEHWNPLCGVSGCWVTDTSTSTAFAPNGSTCWTSQTTVASPSCGSPPSTGSTTKTDYYDLAGHVAAEVGPGGSGTVQPGGSCDPTAALGTYSINTSDLCAFTTYSVYNEAGQLIETIQPSLSSSPSGYVTTGATTTYGYDLNGNRTSEVNPAGNTVTTTYDAANRKTGVSYSDSSNTISYQYNVDGTRSEMLDSTGTTSYSYDNAGRPSSVTDSNGKTVTYGYNAFGQESCNSYPGFTHDCTSSGAGTTSPPTGDVTYLFDSQSRLSSVVDWNGDAFTYGYDCTGDVAWMAETPNTQIPAVTPCQGSSGTVPTAPTPSSGTTYVVTAYNYSPGSSGNLLSYKTTSAVTSSGSTALLGFGNSSSNILYDSNNNVTSMTPYVNGNAQTADNFSYDNQQRVIAGPETSGSKTSYSYANTSTPASCTQPFCSSYTGDQMAIDASPLSGTAAQLGSEYSGSGELCWSAMNPSSTTGTCATPSSSSSSYETYSYDASGDRTGTAPTGGYGTSSALTWNQDAHTLSCVNPSGSTCTTPSSSSTTTANYTYNGDGLRVTAATWNISTTSVQNIQFSWDANTSALLSDGSSDYIYGSNTNVPIAQIHAGDSVTSELLVDTNSNVRGLVEISGSAAHPYALAAYTDYDSYGNPITGNGGSTNPGGLTKTIGSDPDSTTLYGFGGGYADTTALIYLVNRYYDSQSGGFVSVDPNLNSTGTPYAYAIDSPTMNTDLLGRSVCPAFEPVNLEYGWQPGPTPPSGCQGESDYIGIYHLTVMEATVVSDGIAGAVRDGVISWSVDKIQRLFKSRQLTHAETYVLEAAGKIVNHALESVDVLKRFWTDAHNHRSVLYVAEDVGMLVFEFAVSDIVAGEAIGLIGCGGPEEPAAWICAALGGAVGWTVQEVIQNHLWDYWSLFPFL